MSEYTAQEMRQMAGQIEYDRSVQYYPTVNHISAMLRQAADIRERCEAKLHSMRFDHYSPEIEDVKDFIKEMLVYILRGDAGKEEK